MIHDAILYFISTILKVLFLVAARITLFASNVITLILNRLSSWYGNNPSPDCSKNPFVAGFATKDCNAKQEIAPKSTISNRKSYSVNRYICVADRLIAVQ